MSKYRPKESALCYQGLYHIFYIKDVDGNEICQRCGLKKDDWRKILKEVDESNQTEYQGER